MKSLFGIVSDVFSDWIEEFIESLIPSPGRARLVLKNLYQGKRERSNDRFRIVLCWLEDDHSGADTYTVERAFRNVSGVTLIRSASVVKATGAADAWRLEMRKKAHAVLAHWNADLVVTGFVNKSESALSLWLVPHEGDGTLNRGERWPYALEKTVILGQDFHDDLQAQLTAVALAAVAPLADNEIRGRVLEQGLSDATGKLRTLLEASTIEQPEHRAALQTALGSALDCLGDREIGPDFRGCSNRPLQPIGRRSKSLRGNAGRSNGRRRRTILAMSFGNLDTAGTIGSTSKRR